MAEATVPVVSTHGPAAAVVLHARKRASDSQIGPSTSRTMTHSSHAGCFRPVAFRALPPSADFSRSVRLELPAAPSEQDAWRELFAAMAGNSSLIGGTVERILSA